MLSGSKDEFNHLNKYLLHFSKQLVLESLVELNEESHRLQMRFMDLIHSENAQLDLQLNKIARQAVHRLNMEKESELPNKLELIQRMSVNHLQQKQLELKGLEDLLSMLDPKRLLENGYTISTIDDVDLYEVSTNLLGKEMKTLTTHSLITSKITDTQKK
jgi:exonuclease VII large subunit